MNLLAFEISQWLVGLMVVFFLFVSLCMMLIVLIQRPQGGGLSGAFGGGGAEGAGQTAFGAKTGDVLTTVTIGIFVVFLVSAVGLNYVVRRPAAPEEPVVTSPSPAPGQPAGAGTPTTVPAPAGSQAAAPSDPSVIQKSTLGDDGKHRLESEAGTIESVIPVERIAPPPGLAPGGTPPPQPSEPAPSSTPPATAPESPPATSPATPPSQDPQPKPQ